MKAIQIVNRLKEILSKYTDDFSDIINISNLTRNSTTITATTTLNHNLKTGDYITIRGAKEPIALISLSRNEYIATATSNNDHKLIDPSQYSISNLPLYIEISGADSGYNGVFELLTVPTNKTFTFKLTTQPVTPATIAGFLLLEDQEGYNGYKQITKISNTVFTYQTTGNMESPAKGLIQLSNATRVAYSATSERVKQFYSENLDNDFTNWLYVIMDGKNVFKNDTISTDISALKRQNQDYYYETSQEFSIYIILPSKNSLLAGDIADNARSYENVLLKCLANYQFTSDLDDEYLQPCIYNGNETDDYIKSYYVHRFAFAIKGDIQNTDVCEQNNGTPLKIIDGSIASDVDYLVNIR